jgi:hypothetical protein
MRRIVVRVIGKKIKMCLSSAQLSYMVFIAKIFNQ